MVNMVFLRAFRPSKRGLPVFSICQQRWFTYSRPLSLAAKKTPEPAPAAAKPSPSASKPKSDDQLPDRIEFATGMEKKQLLALLHGDDRYEPKIYAPAPGTKEEPNVVPIHGESRMVGCICEPDQHYVNYMMLNMGEMKRCECGYWFKSVKGDPDIF